MGGIAAIGRSLDNPATAELFILAGLVFLLVGGLGQIAITIQADRAERAVTGVLGLLLIGAGLVFLQPTAVNPTGSVQSSSSNASARVETTPAPTVSSQPPTAAPTMPPPTATTATAIASTTSPVVQASPSPAAGASTGITVASAAAGAAPATPVPPSATAVPLPSCKIYPVRGFGLAYRTNSGLAFRLGCATAPEVGVPASQETFERGVMIKPTNGELIYVIRADGSWKSYGDTYQVGEVLPVIGGIPANLLAPDHGFGKLWRQQADVRQSLGWATGPEQAIQAATEPFAAGQMLWTSDRKIYALFSDGTGRSFADQYVDPTATPT